VVVEHGRLRHPARQGPPNAIVAGYAADELRRTISFLQG